MKALKKIDTVLYKIRVVGLVALLAACILMCLTNIILRYVVRGVPTLRPFSWVNELMQMGAIWIGFLAAGLGVKQNAHVSLESLTKKYLPEKASKILRIIAQVVVIVALAVLVVVGVKVTISQSHSFLQNLHISNAWFYSAIPVGCFFLLYDYLIILLFGDSPFGEAEKAGNDCASGAF